MRKVTSIQEGRGHRPSVPAQGLPRTTATCLSLLWWWECVHNSMQTFLFTVPGNSFFPMEKFLIVPIGSGHTLHNIKEDFWRLTATLRTHCASRLGLCAISEVSLHFFPEVRSKAGLSSRILHWSRKLEGSLTVWCCTFLPQVHVPFEFQHFISHFSLLWKELN